MFTSPTNMLQLEKLHTTCWMEESNMGFKMFP